VDVACDGAEGLDRIVEADGAYDLVVSDIRMPLMDGIEMAKKAAAGYPGLKILLVTGFADQRERAADLDGVVVDVLLKPFTLDAIRAAVSTHLAAAAA
jgi:CheY-like chemotaxis protein